MDAVVAACHFCEVHGPKVLFCCQPWHNEDSCAADSTEAPSSSRGTFSEHHKQFYGNYKYLSRRMSGLLSSSFESISTEVCEACHAVEGFNPGFLTNDHENKVSFVSGQNPYPSQLFSVVRQACLRSLSCEVCPGREGPIFFGNETHGYTTSHTFTLKDSKARGFQHWYSLIVVCMDKLLLLNSYLFFVSNFKLIIEELQWKAKVIFEEEQRQAERDLKSIRLASSPANYLRHRAASGGNPRALTELTGDANVFSRLHRHFVWLLSANDHRVREVTCSGRLSEDVKIQAELISESQTDVNGSGVAAYSHPHYCGSGSNANTSIGSKQKCLANLRVVSASLGPDLLRRLLYNTVVGNQVIIRSDSKPILVDFLDALQLLLPLGCCKVIGYSTRYEESWKCNLLGVCAAAIIPEHILENGQSILINADENHSGFAASGPSFSLSVHNSTLAGASFSICSRSRSELELPVIVERYAKVLNDSNFSDGLVDAALTALKEEWMSKVMAVFTFTREKPGFLASEMNRVKSVLNIGDNDYPVIRFWTAGLSKEYKRDVLNYCMKVS